MDLQIAEDQRHTEVGSYFVANYPPFSVWSPEHIPAYLAVLARGPGWPAEPDFGAAANGRQTGGQVPLGLYLHIPFCRKRCKFCYFRVYTDKNSSDVDVYLKALAKEAEIYAGQEALQGRSFDFVYFG